MLLIRITAFMINSFQLKSMAPVALWFTLPWISCKPWILGQMEQRAGADAFVKQLYKGFWIGKIFLLLSILFARPNSWIFVGIWVQNSWMSLRWDRIELDYFWNYVAKRFPKLNFFCGLFSFQFYPKAQCSLNSLARMLSYFRKLLAQLFHKRLVSNLNCSFIKLMLIESLQNGLRYTFEILSLNL